MYLGVVLLSLSAALFVYQYVYKNQVHVVDYSSSDRALKDNELPNEQKPTVQEVIAYKTDNPLYPKKLVISRLGFSARVIPLGIDKNKRIEAPANIHDIGWLKSSSTPLAQEGFTVLDGHVQGRSAEGVFKNLDKLAIGEGVQIETNNGTQISFTVSSRRVIDFDEPAEKSLLAPPKNGVFELRLITCAGSFNKQNNTYDKRLLVTAVRQN